MAGRIRKGKYMAMLTIHYPILINQMAHLTSWVEISHLFQQESLHAAINRAKRFSCISNFKTIVLIEKPVLKYQYVFGIGFYI